eukprot:TRINITY_DN17567_c0_g1_i1.p1 TRINITY_DN17567_c0_g1~~TRINITY_DN17567_c0_g1_i1.p1  ORF type:complete len:700 (+),score=75.14 TRINITY_DN17567_c0_g1_i1:77-2176(+)
MAAASYNERSAPRLEVHNCLHEDKVPPLSRVQHLMDCLSIEFERLAVHVSLVEQECSKLRIVASDRIDTVRMGATCDFVVDNSTLAKIPSRQPAFSTEETCSPPEAVPPANKNDASPRHDGSCDSHWSRKGCELRPTHENDASPRSSVSTIRERSKNGCAVLPVQGDVDCLRHGASRDSHRPRNDCADVASLLSFSSFISDSHEEDAVAPSDAGTEVTDVIAVDPEPVNVQKGSDVLRSRRAVLRDLDKWEIEAAEVDVGPAPWFRSRPRLWMIAESDIKSPFRRSIHRIISHPLVEQIMGLFIVVDGVVFGVEAQNGAESSPNETISWITRRCTLILRCIFLIELLCSIYARTFKEVFRHPWGKFDTVLVIFSVFDTVIEALATAYISAMTVVRVLRIARLCRAVRLLAQCRTLWLLASGLRCCMSTVLWTFVFIAISSYIFAIIGIETLPLRDTDGLLRKLPIVDEVGNEVIELTNYQRLSCERFGSFPVAMLTLLQVLTHDSIATIYTPMILDVPPVRGWFNLVYFLAFIMLVSIFIMNLVTAVMVESALQAAASDQLTKRVREEARRVSMVPKLREMFWALDDDCSGEITIEEIATAPKWLADELKNLTRTDGLCEVFQLLDDDDDGVVQIDEFLDGILKASAGDVIVKLQVDRLVRQCSQISQAIAILVSLEDNQLGKKWLERKALVKSSLRGI